MTPDLNDQTIDINQDNGIHLVEPENPLPSTSIADLPELVRAAVASVGWFDLTPVQSHAIPYVLQKRDMMIQSRTGSGKTGAFILPLLADIDPALKGCQAMILVPTRELAQQVTTETTRLAKGTGVQCIGVYGGVGYGPQLEALEQGVQIVIGTPGRILDHLMRGALRLSGLHYLILDEADRMLSMGFYPDMKDIERYLPRKRSGFMFSATFPVTVRRLAAQFLNKPDFLSLSRDVIHVADTQHLYYDTPAMDKDRCLVRIIEIENPESAIIFCNTKNRVNYIATVLQRFGYDADQLTADLRQSQREAVLGRLKKKSLRFLVATDLAGRGIDITELSHVINYEIPEDPDSYIHRTGRTGRAGAAGIAMSLTAGSEFQELMRISKRYGIDMEQRELPSEEDVQNIGSQKMVALLEGRRRRCDKPQQERMKRFLPLVRQLMENEKDHDLLAMILDDLYQEDLHALPVPDGSGKKNGATPDREAGQCDPQGEEDDQNILGQKMTTLLGSRLTHRDKLQQERMKRFLPLVRQLMENDEEHDLLAMILDDLYLEDLHAPRSADELGKKSRGIRDLKPGWRGNRPRPKGGSPGDQAQRAHKGSGGPRSGSSGGRRRVGRKKPA
jgi:ATP-dependent RNA helicase DeaD